MDLEAIVIDDVPVVRQNVSALLRKLGLTVHEFERVDKALRRVAKKQISKDKVRIIVSDLYDEDLYGDVGEIEEVLACVGIRIAEIKKLQEALPGAKVLIFSIYKNVLDAPQDADVTRQLRGVLSQLEEMGINSLDIVPKFGEEPNSGERGLALLKERLSQYLLEHHTPEE